MLDKYVYHSSPKSGLTTLTPKKSTHGESWVYATRDKLVSAAFLGREGGDFTCLIGRNKEGKLYITERFEGAFKLRYSIRASIYILSSADFLENKTSWKEEVVCSNKVEIIEEEKIDNAYEYLMKLDRNKEIIISKYPEKYMAPDNDEDLVKKGILWTKQFGPETLEQIKKYHPQLLKRVKDGLE